MLRVVSLVPKASDLFVVVVESVQAAAEFLQDWMSVAEAMGLIQDCFGTRRTHPGSSINFSPYNFHWYTILHYYTTVIWYVIIQLWPTERQDRRMWLWTTAWLSHISILIYLSFLSSNKINLTFTWTGLCSTKSISWSSGGGGQATLFKPDNEKFFQIPSKVQKEKYKEFEFR